MISRRGTFLTSLAPLLRLSSCRHHTTVASTSIHQSSSVNNQRRSPNSYSSLLRRQTNRLGPPPWSSTSFSQSRTLISSSTSNKEKNTTERTHPKMPYEDYTNFQSLSYLCSVAFLYGFLGAFFLFGLLIGLLVVFGWVGLLYYIHLVREQRRNKEK